MSTPLFSIITVTYNASATIGPTIESIAAQSYLDYEHIIVDGASTDNTLYKIRSAATGARVYSEPDNGIYDAMNRGLGYACGTYVIFLNAGDTFHDCDTLRLYADAIKSNDYPGIVYGQTDIVSGAERRRIGSRHLTAPATLTLDSFAHGMVVCHQAMAVLRRITPLYNLKYKFSSDYEWCIRCLQHSRKNVYIDQVVADYLQEGTTTRNHNRSLIERFRIMCHYYGTAQTIGRHFKFAGRALNRHIKHNNSTTQP